MIVILFTMLDGVMPDVVDPRRVWLVIGGELLLFDAPAIAIFIYLIRSAFS